MKIIRTKDGIYELMPNIEQKYEVSFDGKTLEPAYYTINTDWIAKKDVVDKADTIEELCDEIRYGNHKRCYYDVKHGVWFDFKSNRKLSKEKILTIYGAIWTDKGLIYVAKMNDKGELELL